VSQKSQTEPLPLLQRVKGRKSHPEQIWSAPPQIADIDFSREDFSVGPLPEVSLALSNDEWRQMSAQTWHTDHPRIQRAEAQSVGEAFDRCIQRAPQKHASGKLELSTRSGLP
jgi:hypothetical protein